MTWAQRLKRIFGIEIEKCDKCGGKVKIIASIEDPDVIEKILKHLGLGAASQIRIPFLKIFQHIEYFHKKQLDYQQVVVR